MLPEIKDYLGEVRSHLYLDPATEEWVLRDLAGYFQEKIADLQDAGLSEKEAAGTAIETCGRPRVIARQMYEAHSKGSWSEAALASLPHLLIAGLFITHLWRHPVLVPVIFCIVVYVTLYGWWRGKPSWLYPWVSYSLLPLLIGAYISWPTIQEAASFSLRWGNSSFPSVWILLLTCIVFGFSGWIIIRTTIRVVRRDWILASMMLVSFPIFGGWFLNLDREGGLFKGHGNALYASDTLMVLALMALALTCATFIRLRQRVMKTGALVVIGSIAFSMIGHNLWGDYGFVGFLGSSILLLLFLLSPALLEAKIGHGEQKNEMWFENDWLDHPPTAI